MKTSAMTHLKRRKGGGSGWVEGGRGCDGVGKGGGGGDGDDDDDDDDDDGGGILAMTVGAFLNSYIFLPLQTNLLIEIIMYCIQYRIDHRRL